MDRVHVRASLAGWSLERTLEARENLTDIIYWDQKEIFERDIVGLVRARGRASASNIFLSKSDSFSMLFPSTIIYVVSIYRAVLINYSASGLLVLLMPRSGVLARAGGGRRGPEPVQGAGHEGRHLQLESGRRERRSYPSRYTGLFCF